MHIGAVGVDSSHLPEFTKRINTLHDEGKTSCRVTHVFDPGEHDLPNAPKWLEATKGQGPAQAAQQSYFQKSMLDQVKHGMIPQL